MKLTLASLTQAKYFRLIKNKNKLSSMPDIGIFYCFKIFQLSYSPTNNGFFYSFREFFLNIKTFFLYLYIIL